MVTQDNSAASGLSNRMDPVLLLKLGRIKSNQEFCLGRTRFETSVSIQVTYMLTSERVGTERVAGAL